MSKYSEMADRLDAAVWGGVSETASALRELEARVSYLENILQEILDSANDGEIQDAVVLCYESLSNREVKG